ncbi:transporter substrate-binding domain-containing protein [Ruegeria pomeroyi]|uniref:Polar amino acid uptake family ABC transporter, periplasmic substrate-binding protein n=2 Tax=Ruegeria pomeroyi TaxID=89184 RepID=Q5LP12_RUEPO|nr:transporter substrate-binding domain-containing protein [Ruegeria pomeroyi]HCE71123.1 ABC transporter substrate-binding protein [Ruegeria sp.]AAV96276.1 polar amino acid uptake family ABC transporter, periplasmic substrate-binding protein [Ruegeria pomeroyi DSS-3]NVK99083.1 transporter substrate-binding domain-containing protein [Ruegeria pomeroyi]NVL01842.1 transporter substrate-binding domain-containing protein [Ruegeria pomeroyi]QWV09825.1 transporter substrate-binding domain-containing 
MKHLIATTALASLTLAPIAATAAECTNDAWNRIQERGKIVVGVKADYKPWGFRDTDGSIIGMEIDMAAEVAKTLGVELELTPVVASNRMQFLEQGQIDLMIATMTDRADRREIVGIVGPNYYTSGTNILAPKALGFSSWNELNGKPVCGVQGAFYNQIVEDKYGAQIVAFAGAAEARQALRDKKCVAFVYDDSSIGSAIASGEWEDFEMPLASEDDSPWGLAVPKGEENCIFGRFMTGMQYSWHQNGSLINWEAKWGIKPTAYLQELNAKLADQVAE